MALDAGTVTVVLSTMAVAALVVAAAHTLLRTRDLRRAVDEEGSLQESAGLAGELAALTKDAADRLERIAAKMQPPDR